MKLRLQEDPREWRKFGVNSALVLALVTGLLCWKGVLPKLTASGVLGALLAVAILAMARPAWCRGPYRLGMRVSHVLGRLVAPVILGLIFFLMVLPLGLLLRLLGKDLLALRRQPGTPSYWRPVSGSKDLERMF